MEEDGFQPFWTVIGHKAVLDIERQPTIVVVLDVFLDNSKDPDTPSR